MYAACWTGAIRWTSFNICHLHVCRARAAREAKFAGQDEKRRRMRETLERNEKAAATGRSEEAEARTRLQVSISPC